MEFNLADLFEGVADVCGDLEALVCGESRLTYAELEERSNRLAHWLADRGIRSGDRVGLQMRNCTEFVEALIGTLKIRAVPVNVNFRYVAGELRYLYEDAGLRALVLHDEFVPRAAEVAPDVAGLDVVAVVGGGRGAGALDATRYEAALAASSPERDFPGRSGDDLWMVYTGGTTGMPKGVIWRQEDVFFAGMGGGNPGGEPVAKPEEVAENAAVRHHLTMCLTPPLIHGAAQFGTFIGLFWGDKVVLVEDFSGESVWDAVAAEKANSVAIVGDAMARPMADALEEKGDGWDLSSLFVISTAGAITSPSVKERIKARLPNVTILESFGSSETGFQGSATAESGNSSLGGGLRFRMGERSSVFTDDLRAVVPGSGEVGTLALSGRIPLGYHNDPEKTAGAFVEIEGVRWVLLGDMATIDADGSVRVFGRGSVCINSGGEKVYPEEVEGVLKANPGGGGAGGGGGPGAGGGVGVGGGGAPGRGRAPSRDALGAHCREHLAGYKAPREVHLVEEVVRSPSGKADYTWAKAAATGGETGG